MTQTGSIPPPAPSASGWETCDHCQAPLDERQRYCVACGARRVNSADPAARYLADATRRARSGPAPTARPTAARGRSGLTTAVVLALLPLAAGIGVVVGRSAKSDDELLVEALKAQKAPVVNVGEAGGAAAKTASTDTAPKKQKAKRGDDDPNDADGKVIATSRYGTARQLTGSKPTPAQLEESKKALDKIVNSKGKEYVDQQRGLPDQIVIP